MARTPAGFHGGVRIPDRFAVNFIAQIYPRDTVRDMHRLTDSDSRRRWDLPAEVMVYHVIAMASLRTVFARKEQCYLVAGLPLSASGLAVKVSKKFSKHLFRAGLRLGKGSCTSCL